MSEFITCEKCNGTGIIVPPREESPPKLRWDHCKKCKGTGRLTWLEILFKKTKLPPEERLMKKENTKKYLRSIGIYYYG